MSKHKALHIDDQAAVGLRLKEARTRAGISQRALAAPFCTAAYISRIEAGERTPSLQLLREFGKRLGVSADWLATGESRDADSRLVDAEIALRLDDLERARTLYEAELDRDPEPAPRSDALEGLGQIAFREERYGDAIDLLEEALKLAGDDPGVRPSLVDTLARGYAAVGHLPAAIALLRRALLRSKELNDPIQAVRYASLLGYALTDNGDFEEAERVLAAALETGRGVRDPYTRARLYWSQTRLLSEEGHTDAAERYARKTLETLRATEDGYAIAHALETLAHICIDLGRSDEALRLLDEGRPLIEAWATPTEVAHYRLEEARALAAVGETERAGALAMELAGELGEAQPADAGRAYLLLGEVFAELGEADRAKEILELAIASLEQQAPSKYLIRAYRRLAEVLKGEGRRDEALELLEKALRVQERIGRVASLS